ncbi:NAD(P)-binding protein [Serendipita vermifera]|nr:NAD(P)-binding protein [Serendipita vermifera]
MSSAVVEIFGDTLYYKWIRNLPETSRDLSGRTVIVTGANVGVGLEAARFFYNMSPARLVIAVRSISKGEEAKMDIEAKGDSAGQTSVEVWELDLGLFESVKRFAEKCNDELERVDIFLENAALGEGPWSTTPDGWESLVQVNVISTYMLAALIAPLLRKTAKLPDPNPAKPLKPHLVIASSDVHPFTRFPQRTAPNILAALNEQTTYDIPDRYALTKFLTVVLTRSLAASSFWSADGHSKDDVVICCANPGFCRSNLLRNVPNFTKWIVWSIFAKHPSEGAKNYTWACLNDDIPAGAYISMCKVANTFGMVNTEEGSRIEEKVWGEIAELVTAMAPETEPVWKISK